MNIQKVLQQAQKLKNELAEAQSRIQASEHEGSAGGGLVRITMKGNHKVMSIHVDPSLLQEDASMIEDMFSVALTDVLNKIEQFSKEQTPALPGGLGL